MSKSAKSVPGMEENLTADKHKRLLRIESSKKRQKSASPQNRKVENKNFNMRFKITTSNSLSGAVYSKTGAVERLKMKFILLNRVTTTTIYYCLVTAASNDKFGDLAISVPEMFQILNFIWSNFRKRQERNGRERRHDHQWSLHCHSGSGHHRCVIKSNFCPGAPPPNLG